MLRGPGLEITRLAKAFGGTAVLKGIDLTVAPGEFISLLGPSGCGKTTTLNVIAGFEAPDEGDVWLDGENITRLPSHRRGLGMVFQNHALFPHMTVAENIGFGLKMRKLSETEVARRIGDALEMVRLSGFETRYPRQLSGGQQQRVGLARALTVRPKVILLDEPLSSLDAQLRRDMKVEIRRILRSVNTTAVYVTHDQEEALTMSDRIVLMNSGKVEQVGAPEELYARPASEFVAGFIGQASFFDGTVTNPWEGRVELDQGGVANILANPASYRAGDRLRLAVRPDRVGLARKASDGPFEGIVSARAFVGPMLHYEVGLPSGSALLAHAPANGSSMAEPGDAVSILVDPADWMILQAPET